MLLSTALLHRSHGLRTGHDRQHSTQRAASTTTAAPHEMDHTASVSIPSTSTLPSHSYSPPTEGEHTPLLPSSSALPRSESQYGTTRSPTPPSILSRPPKRLLRTRCCLALLLNILVLCIWSLFAGVEQVEEEVACATCLGILIPLQALAHVGDDAFSKFFIQICTQLHVSLEMRREDERESELIRVVGGF